MEEDFARLPAHRLNEQIDHVPGRIGLFWDRRREKLARRNASNALNEPDPILGTLHDSSNPTQCAACSREIHSLAWHIVGRPELAFCTRRCLATGAVR